MSYEAFGTTECITL